jgi:hypothetical protein
MTIAQTNTRKAQGEWPTDKFLGQIHYESWLNVAGTSIIFPTCTRHSATSLIYTPDTATSFIRPDGTISNYIYASNIHTTWTTQLHYPHIPSSNNKQSINLNSTLLRSRRERWQRWQWRPAILARGRGKKRTGPEPQKCQQWKRTSRKKQTTTQVR